MNNKVMVIGLVIIAFIGIGVFLVSQNSKEKSGVQEDQNLSVSESPEQESMESVDESNMQDESGSSYIEYSKDAFSKITDKRRVLFFYASWCPTCIPTDKNLSENVDKIPDDLTVVRVNYNDPSTDQDEKDLARKYNVTYQHTFVQIDENGQEIAKWNGGKIEEFLKNIN